MCASAKVSEAARRFRGAQVCRPFSTGLLTGDAPAEVSVFDLNAPKRPVKEMQKGVEAWDKGQLAEAEQAFKNAVLLYPSFSRAYNNLGVVFLREGRRDDAEWSFRQALRIDNRSPRVLSNLAYALFEEGLGPLSTRVSSQKR